MASAAGMIGSCGAACSSILAAKAVSRGGRHQRPAVGARCAYGSAFSQSRSGASLTEQYRTLRIQPGASETEVRKAFRQLALQYHPDVCKGSNCVVQFHEINEAYDVVMSSLRESEEDRAAAAAAASSRRSAAADSQMYGRFDPTYDLWEEWMGFEGATHSMDYSSHINPYI